MMVPALPSLPPPQPFEAHTLAELAVKIQSGRFVQIPLTGVSPSLDHPSRGMGNRLIGFFYPSIPPIPHGFMGTSRKYYQKEVGR